MSETNWDLPSSGDDYEATSEGFRQLRKGYDSAAAKAKAAEKRAAEAEARISELEKLVNEKSLSELTSKLPDNVRKHLTKEFRLEKVEPTEANVKQWLDENAADYGYDPKAQTSQPQTNADPLAALGLTPEQVQGLQALGLGAPAQDPGLSDEDASALRATQALFAGRTPGNLGQAQLLSQIGDLDKRVESGDITTAELMDQFRQMGAPVSGTRIRD